MKKKRAKKTKALSGTAAGEVVKQVGTQALTKAVGWIAGIGAFYLFIGKPVLESIGVLKSKADKERDDATKTFGTSLQSAFNPNYYKSVPGAVLLTRADAERFAVILYKAIGNFTDDENSVYSVFRRLKAKTQVSWIASIFAAKYNADLYNYLRRNLKDSEMDIVHGMVNSLS
jgi:hypothetical protein